MEIESIVSLLKWLSHGLLVISGGSALFHELYKRHPETGRQTLTRIGWLHLAGLAVGFLLFGATEINGRFKAISDRTAWKARDEKQTLTIDSLKETRQKQDETIGIQKRQNNRLEELLLASYELSGIEIALRPPPRTRLQFPTKFKEVRADMVAAGLPPQGKLEATWEYFSLCLTHGRLEARKGERDQWLVHCEVNRPLGFTRPFLYCPPDSLQWRGFEALLDLLLGSEFKVRLANGADLILLSEMARPATVFLDATELRLTVLGPRVKLSQLSNAQVLFQMRGAEQLAQQVRLRSMDPLVQFDQSYYPVWSKRKTGTAVIQEGPDEEPRMVEVRVPMAGPFPLPVRLDDRFASIEQVRASDSIAAARGAVR